MTDKLHILFLCSWFPSKEFPTNGDFIQRHAKAVSTKHKVSILHLISSKKVSKTTIEKSTETNLTTYIGYVKHSKNPIVKAFRFYKTYQKIIKQIRSFDLTHLNTLFPFGLFALHQKWIHKKPFIISEHWTGFLKERKNKISFFQKFWSKKIVKKAHFVCPVNNELKNGMLNYNLKGNYFTVGNVVDTNVFIPADKKANAFTIVHVSGLNDEQKNISDMLKVAKLLENEIEYFNWKFIGGTSEKYQNLITDLDFKSAKIEFVNHVTQQELATHLQQANLCISFSNYETFGIVMPEAIACGTFVISTNTGILNELKPQKFFSIIPKKDTNALKNEIINQYKNPVKLNSKEMHLFVKTRFSKEVISENFSDLYYKTLNNNS